MGIRIEKCEMEMDLDSEEKRDLLQTTSTRRMNRPKPLTPLQVDEALSAASRLVFGAGLMFSNWGKRMRESADVNKLPVLEDQTEYMNAGGDPNIFYYHSYYELMKDE